MTEDCYVKIVLKPQQGNSFRCELIKVWSLSASVLINNTGIELVGKKPLHLRLLIQNSFRSRHKLLLRSSKTWRKPDKLNVQACLHDLQHLLSVPDVSGTDKYLKIYWYLFVWLQYADKKKVRFKHVIKANTHGFQLVSFWTSPKVLRRFSVRLSSTQFGSLSDRLRSTFFFLNT